MQKKKIVVIGKSQFDSKKGNKCYVIYWTEEVQNVEGKASFYGFFGADVYNQVRVNTEYNVMVNHQGNNHQFAFI